MPSVVPESGLLVLVGPSVLSFRHCVRDMSPVNPFNWDNLQQDPDKLLEFFGPGGAEENSDFVEKVRAWMDFKKKVEDEDPNIEIGVHAASCEGCDNMFMVLGPYTAEEYETNDAPGIPRGWWKGVVTLPALQIVHQTL